MDKPPSPKPPSAGLVQADLAFSWPAWTNGRSSTPPRWNAPSFGNTDDLQIFETPSKPIMTPPVKKRDPLAEMIKGFIDTPSKPTTKTLVTKKGPRTDMLKSIADTPANSAAIAPAMKGHPVKPSKGITATPLKPAATPRIKKKDHMAKSSTGVAVTPVRPATTSPNKRKRDMTKTPKGAVDTPSATRQKHPAPEDIWKKAVANDSPPAILRSIVTTLHRSLKSKEDAIREIAAEYGENALRLIDSMSSRHSLERIQVSKSYHGVSHAILAAFAAAEKDLADTVEEIKGLDIRSALETTKRPPFLRKLRIVIRLYEAQLSFSLGMPIFEADLAPKEDATTEAHAGGQDEKLVEDFRAKLQSKIKGPAASTAAARHKIRAKVDLVLREQLPGQKPVGSTKAKTREEILEEMFDKTISSFRERLDPELFDRIVREADEPINVPVSDKNGEKAPAGIDR